MANKFELIGKLTLGKETDKFKPFKKEISKNNSKWESTSLNATVVAGDNRHFVEVRGGNFTDGSGKLYLFTKQTKDANGSIIKGEKLVIDYKDRFDEKIIEKTAEFKKFVFDLEEPNRRKALIQAVKEFKEGTLTDEKMAELGIDNPEEALEQSNKKRKVFLSEVDFAEYIYKVIKSGKIDNRLFKIEGERVDSEYNGKFYKKLNVQKIYLADKSATPSSIGTLDIFFTQGAIDSTRELTDQKLYIDGFIKCYDSNKKKDMPFPVQVVLDLSKDENDEKIARMNRILRGQFTVLDGTWKQLGVKVKLINGSQKMEITEDMLNDFQKEMLDIGAMSMDDIRAELGGDLYGEAIEEMTVINVAKGFNKGRIDTAYTDSDFTIAEQVDLVSEDNIVSDDDIFADMDDLDI